MSGGTRAYRLEIRSTEVIPSEETQKSVLPAMSQKFGQGVALAKTELDDGSRGTTTIGTVTTRNTSLLLDVYEYLGPNDLVKVGDIHASDGCRVVTRRLHEIDREQISKRDTREVLGEAAGRVLVCVRPDGDGSH